MFTLLTEPKNSNFIHGLIPLRVEIVKYFKQFWENGWIKRELHFAHFSYHIFSYAKSGC